MGWDKDSTTSFAGRVRAAARKVGVDGSWFSAADLSHAVGVQTFDGNKRLHWAVRDLKKSGELVVVGKGLYRLGEPKPKGRGGIDTSQNPQKRVVMWRFLRMRRRVSVGDLQEAAGVSEEYAREWVQMLQRQGVVKALKGGTFQLLADSPEVPKDRAKAEKLRELRRVRKNRLESAIDQAQIRLTEAGQLLDDARCALAALSQIEANEEAG